MFPKRTFTVAVFLFLQIPLRGMAQQAQGITKDVPEVVLQVPHAAWITAIAVSRDGKHYATSSADTTIELWDTGTGLMERVLKGHQGSVTDICFSPDSRFLVSGSEDGSVRVWDVTTGVPTQRLVADGPVGRVVWSPDGKQVAATTDKLALTWDTGNWVRTQFSNLSIGLRLSVGVYSSDSRTLLFDGGGEIALVDSHTGVRTPDVRFPAALRGEPNGRYSAGVFNEQIGVWDGQAMKPVKVLDVDEHVVTVAAVSPDGQLIAATGDHDDVAVWSVASGKEVFRWEGKSSLSNPTRMDAVAFSMDSKSLFTGDSSGQFQRFQIETGIELQRSHAPMDRMLRADYTGDGTMVIASSNEVLSWAPDGTISNFGLERKESWLCPWAPNYAIRPGSDELTYCDVQGIGGIDLHTGQTTNYGRQIQSASLAWSEKGDYLAAAASYDGVIECKHIVLYHVVGETREARDLPFAGCTEAALFTKDEQTLVLGTTSYTGPTMPVFGAPAPVPPNAEIEYVDVATGKVTHTVSVPGQSVVSLAQISDGSKLAALLSSGAVLLLNAQGIELHRWTLANATTRPDWAGHAISFSHRGDILAVSNGDVISLLASSPPYAEVRSLQVGSGQFAHAVSFSPGDDRLLVAGDNSASLRSLPDGVEMAKVYLSGNDGYFVVTPEGYYMSYGAGDLVAFRYRDHIYPFDEFDIRYNRPDKVLGKISPASDEAVQAYHQAWLKRLEHLGLSEENASAPLGDAPRVSADTVSSSADSVRLRISAVPARSPLRELLVSVNGSPLHLAAGSRPQGQANAQWSTEIAIPLSPGENVIHISIRDAAGNISLRQTLQTYSVQPHAKPRLFALLVGVSKYQQASFDLTYADHDAETLSRFLQRQNGEYSQIKVTALLNEQATHSGILSAAKKLGGASQDDHVIIVLSGHGMLDKEGNYYFAPHDMDFAHPQQSGITYTDLESALSGLASRDKLLLIDSCHAGEVDNLPTFSSKNASFRVDSQVKLSHAKGVGLEPVASFSTASRLMETMFTDLKTGTGTSIIAASAGDEVAFESDKWHNGVFTYAVIRGVSEGAADENGDGVITVEELRRYVDGEVRKLTSGAQQPSTRADNSWNDFAVAMPDRLLKSFALSGSQVTSTSFSPKGGKILASSVNGLYRVWDVGSGMLLNTQGTTGQSPMAAFTSEDAYRSLQANSLMELSLADGSKTTRPFSFGTPPLPLQYPRAFDAATGMAAGHMYSNRGVAQAAVVNVMDGRSGTVASAWSSPLARSDGTKLYAISHDGKLVAEGDSETGSTTSSIQVRDALSGALLQTLTADDTIGSLRFSPDGKWLAAGCSGDHVIIWELAHASNPHSLGAERSKEDGIFSLSFSPDGKRLAAGSSTGVAQIWNLGSFVFEDTVLNRDGISDVCFDPTGKVLAVGGQSGYVRLWDLNLGAFQ